MNQEALFFKWFDLMSPCSDSERNSLDPYDEDALFEGVNSDMVAPATRVLNVDFAKRTLIGGIKRLRRQFF
jgi:hypothetical protein